MSCLFLPPIFGEEWRIGDDERFVVEPVGEIRAAHEREIYWCYDGKQQLHAPCTTVCCTVHTSRVMFCHASSVANVGSATTNVILKWNLREKSETHMKGNNILVLREQNQKQLHPRCYCKIHSYRVCFYHASSATNGGPATLTTNENLKVELEGEIRVTYDMKKYISAVRRKKQQLYPRSYCKIH